LQCRVCKINIPGAFAVESKLSKFTRFECSSIKLATPFFGLAPVSDNPAFISLRLKGLGEDEIIGAKIINPADYSKMQNLVFFLPGPNKFCCWVA